MTTIRLVLADDHHLFRQGLRQLCEVKGGFDVIGEASTGEQAVLLVAELQPDVVLIDINMPQLNGIAATKQIIAANPEARVIVLTMYRQDNYVFEAIKSGAKGYLLKNTDAQDLINGVCHVYDGGTLLDAHTTFIQHTLSLVNKQVFTTYLNQSGPIRLPANRMGYTASSTNVRFDTVFIRAM